MGVIVPKTHRLGIKYRSRLAAGACLLYGLLAGASTATACEIPVFRYALERWEPDPYVALVLHEGPLDAEQQQAVDRLRSARQGRGGALNLEVRTIDVGQPLDEVDRMHLRGREASGELPQLRLQYPVGKSHLPPAWQTPLTAAAVELLIQSPARAEISKRLLAGDSAVWLLLESGDAEQDAAAARELESRIAVLNKQLKLPPQEVLEQDPYYQPTTKVQLALRFSTLRLSRDDPRETAFVAALLGIEPELRNTTQPVAVPVFGRGRALFARVGGAINAKNIEEDCRFISGDCSCVVKEQNPGIDLPLDVAWDEHVTIETDLSHDTLPELTGLGPLERDETLNLATYRLNSDRVNRLSVAPPTGPSQTEPGAEVAAVDADSPPTKQQAAKNATPPLHAEEGSEPETPPDSIDTLPLFALGAIAAAVVLLGLMTLLKGRPQ